jgi:hypothetical protein
MRLRKFNENTTGVDFEYVKDCFVDFLDNGAVLRESYSKDKNIIAIRIPYSIDFNLNGRTYEADEIIEKINSFNDIFQNIEYCIEKANSKYNDQLHIRIKVEDKYNSEGDKVLDNKVIVCFIREIK